MRCVVQRGKLGTGADEAKPEANDAAATGTQLLLRRIFRLRRKPDFRAAWCAVQFWIQGCMDPRMMQQLGGQENLMTMMKEMNKMDLNGMFPGLK